MSTRKDYSRQGPMYLADNLGNGKPGPMRDLGDTGTATISVSTGKETRKESYSSKRHTAAVLHTGSEATISITLRYDQAENLALGWHGKLTSRVSGTVTAETIPTVVVGDIIMLEKGAATNIVLTDSTPTTPASLIAGTHYQVLDAVAGTIKILSLGSLVQPFKAAYSYGASKNLSMLTTKPPVKYFFMPGFNTVDGSRDRIHLYKVQFDPLESLELINESFGDFTITGTCLLDSTNILDPDLGGYGRIEQLDSGA